MRRRRNDDRQPALHRHAAVESQQLHGDLALVVVHGDDAVEVLALQEDGVARERPRGVDAQLPGVGYRGRNVVDLLPAEVAVLAGVWVEGADS